MNPMPLDVQTPLSLWARSAPLAPPSAAVINAILDYGDICEARDDGLLLVRLSATRAAQAGVDSALAGERQRALDVALVWDEREQQIVTVLDAGPFRASSADRPTGNAYADARLRGFPRRIDPASAQAVAA